MRYTPLTRTCVVVMFTMENPPRRHQGVTTPL
jgi:hypothetical protein